MTIRVAVIMGGTATEHDVSLRSGAEVVAHLPADRYDATSVVWRRDGRWEIPAGSEPVGPEIALGRLREHAVAFLAVHGPGGEDGRIQGFLGTAGIPYTGSGVRASAMAMDKIVAKAVAASLGIRVAEQAVITDGAGAPGDATDGIGFPCIVKPVSGGSSADLRLAEDEAALDLAVGDLSRRWSRVMVEAFLTGIEVTGAVLDDPESGASRVLPLVEIRYPGRVFDREAKYTPGVADEICPAGIDEASAMAVRVAAVRMHDALGCRGFSRSDFILVDGVPVYLETNTIPGLTRESLLPRAARTAGITPARLYDGLVRRALAARRQETP
jgi:D-alanine-D-alanine ligase